MSPPIRDGSGSSIGSIRLGDGSEISEVRTGAGDVLFTAIPDSAVFLHEDWGDSEYENRSGTETATYNGVQGIYRPEWTVQTGSSSVSSGQLSFDTDPTVLSTGINIDLSQTVRWFWDINTGGSGRFSGGLFAETNNESTGGGFPALEDGYHIMSRETQTDTVIVREDAGGNTATVAIDTSGSITDGYIGAERTSNGDWTLYGTEGSLSDPKTDLFSSTHQLATGSDSTYTTANFISIGQKFSSGGIIHEGKSF